MGITDRELKHILDQIVNNIIDYYLIMEYGRENGVTISDLEVESAVRDIKKEYSEKIFKEMLLYKYVDFEEWKEGLRQQLLIKKIIAKVSENTTPITFHEIKTYFNTHQEEFRHAEMVRFRQIVAKNKEQAKMITKSLKKGKDLGELARKYSITPEAENGGEVGWVVGGQLEESMEKVLFSLPIGRVSRIVKTPYGYHLFEVLAKRPAGYKSLPEAMKEIKAKLTHEKKESFYKKWLKELRDVFPVQVNQEALKTLEFG